MINERLITNKNGPDFYMYVMKRERDNISPEVSEFITKLREESEEFAKKWIPKNTISPII